MIKIEGDPNIKYDLPVALVTPEKLAEAAEEQRRLARRINSPYAYKTPQDIIRFNSSIIVKETEKILEAVPLKKLPEVARETYAEALAELGNFKQAADATRDKVKRKYYKDIWNAIERPDTDVCKCSHQDFGKHKTHNLFAEANVWSHKHGKSMPVVKCNTCGQRNVRTLPNSLAQAQAQRAKVLSYTTGKSPHEAQQLLTQMNIAPKK